MPANRPNLRPPAGGLLIANPPAPPLPGPRRRRPAPGRTLAALVMLIVCCLIPAVSAETIIDNDFIYHEDSSVSGTTPPATGSGYYGAEFKNIRLTNIEKRSGLSYIILDVPYENANTFSATLPDGEHDLTYTIDSDNPKPCKVYVQTHKNVLQMVTNIRFTIFFDDWDIGDKTGTKTIVLSNWLWIGAHKGGSPTSPVVVYSTHTTSEKYVSGGFDFVVASWVEWKNHLSVIKEESDYYDITLIRNFNNLYYLSTIEIIKNGVTVASDSENINYHSIFALSEIDSIKISGVGQEYSVPLDSSGDGDTASAVTVYVQNSQTGALLADARLSILASAGGTETEIINTTLPGGTATYTLQPTGGGSPNPDYYRAVATVPGYTQIIDNHSFTLTGPHDVIIEMRPDTGGPLDPDRAYLEFYVRDIHANPISSASVQCDGRIKQTNSQGYAVFEVSKNATYPYVAKKSGYVTIEGTATVADGPRYVANVVLGPGTVPTYTPTLGPGETPGGPGATPTPDTRTNEQKGQAIIDLIADFAEPIAILAILATIFGLMKMMTPGRR
jgi:hypothetical protein